uniref:Uncharacterized protein n=1 Tax=Knipowitschia caucasica TaxID=637954 RepID=A0AAV2MQA9_KNICA
MYHDAMMVPLSTLGLAWLLGLGLGESPVNPSVLPRLTCAAEVGVQLTPLTTLGMLLRGGGSAAGARGYLARSFVHRAGEAEGKRRGTKGAGVSRVVSLQPGNYTER